VTRLRLTGLLRHPEEPRVLLLRGDRTWRLPRVATRTETWVADVLVAAQAWERRLGTRPWLLRQLGHEHDETRKVLHALQELALVEAGWPLPANGRWASRQDVARLRLDEEHRPIVSAYLDTVDAVPRARPAWSRPGWSAELRAWLEPQLGPVTLEQAKVWGISTVVRVEAGKVERWFKASAPLPLFVNEAEVTEWLARRFPGYVPRPAAVERERGWLLFEPFDVLGWRLPVDERRELFRRFAELQLRTVELTDELLATGCLDRRLPVLARQLEELLADRRALHRLEAKEVRALRRLAPRFQDLIRRLDGLGLPPTLVHGDLHPGNATRLDGKIAYFDWTDACVAHPFVDLHSLQWERDAATRAAILGAYLQPWGEVAPEEALQEAVMLARVVTPLHHAVSYATIARSLEPTSRSELDATHEFLREAMARVREL
jgi:Phosphotransferase enzyme family